MNIPEITPTDVKARLDSGDKPTLLDVRQPEEVEIASIEGALCIPMNAVPWRLDEMDQEGEIVVFCHHGSRSAQVAQLLSMRGFKNLKNMTGGIDAWAVTVDSSIPRYQFDGYTAQKLPGQK
jgi:rhodanese-related sulfurtransferase